MDNSIPSSAIIRLPKRDEAIEPKTFLDSMDKIWKHLSEEVSKKGSLWILGVNGYEDNQLVPWPLMVVERIATKTRFKLKNVFIWYKEMNPLETKDFVPAYFYILFFVYSLKDYFFDKDSVREPHVFKDIEWGGKRVKGKSAYHDRKVRRYGPKGRDPGNVFYQTKRDDDGRVLEVLEFEPEDIYRKIVLLCSEEKWCIISNIKDNDFYDVVKSLNRKFVPLEVEF